jgi:hypothetical protein
MSRRSLTPALTLCLLAAGWTAASAQPLQSPIRSTERITEVASLTLGQIEGRVVDDAGRPLDGVVISAVGSTSAFAVSDKAGQFSMRELRPGPYLVRAHLQGYLTERGRIIDVRPSAKSPSTFRLRRDESDGARVVQAGVGAAVAPPASDEDGKARDESELAWRLRHLKRSVLRDANGLPVLPEEDDGPFLTDPLEFLGRAMGTSARAAGSLFADLSLDGQVNLLTTGAFDSPGDLLDFERTRGVAFFALGAPVGQHGDWSVRAAMNQTDLSSWIVAGSYAVRAGAAHRYQFGMSYGLQDYQGGNLAARASMPDTARNVGSVFAFDEWMISPSLTVGFGAHYGHYDYLAGSSLFSPQLTATFVPARGYRVRTVALRQLSAPGAQEFLPPTRATWVPPQRTFSPLTADGFRTEGLYHYEVAVDRDFDGLTVGARTFHQRIDDQAITLFGLRRPDSPASALGHYYVGSVGDGAVTGWGISVSHALADNVRGSIDYSLAGARWYEAPPAADAAVLARWVPAAIRPAHERFYDLTTSVETEIDSTATRVFVLYKINSAFLTAEGADEVRGLDGRFDVQVNQALPFMNFLSSRWEMLVAVRNVFRDTLTGASVFDELLVVRPPKRIVGGLTVRF